MKPDHKSGYYNLFMAYFKKGRLQEALVAVNQCYRPGQYRFCLLSRRGIIMPGAERYRLRMPEHEQAIELGENVLVATRNKYCGKADSMRIKLQPLFSLNLQGCLPYSEKIHIPGMVAGTGTADAGKKRCFYLPGGF